MSKKKVVLKAVMILLAGIVAGFILLCLVFLLPTERMRSIQSDTADIMEQEGAHPQVIHGVISTTLDNYTDAQMINIALQGDNNVSFLTRVMNAYRAEYYYGDRPDLCLVSYIRGEEGYDILDYTRYWHGYLTYLKPLLLVFDFGEIRIINVFAQLSLILLVCYQLVKRKLQIYVFPFLGAIFCLMPLATMLSMQYSSVFYVTVIAINILLKYKEWFAQNDRTIYLFLVAGMCTSYTDFLTYPAVAVGMLLVITGILYPARIKDRIVTILASGFSWGCGYLGMWMGKWILADVFLQEGAIQNAISTILYRASSSADSRGGETVSYFAMLAKNLRVICNKPMLLILGVITIILSILAIKRHALQMERVKSAVMILAIGLVPFAWYAISCNHSYIHSYMTYRELAVAVFAFLCFLANIADKRE